MRSPAYFTIIFDCFLLGKYKLRETIYSLYLCSTVCIANKNCIIFSIDIIYYNARICCRKYLSQAHASCYTHLSCVLVHEKFQKQCFRRSPSLQISLHSQKVSRNIWLDAFGQFWLAHFSFIGSCKR